MSRYLFSAMLALSATIASIAQADEKVIPKLSVRGEAILYRPADQMELSVSVVSEGKDPRKTVAENNQKVNHVIAALDSAGLTKEEYQTSRYQIQPVMRYPKEQENRPPYIDSYEVTNTIHIKTTKLDQAEAIIGRVVEAGANQIQDINFNLSNPRAYQQEAIATAYANAAADARVLAQAARVSIVGVASMELERNSPRPFPRMMTATFKSAGSAANVPLEIGDVEVTANVNVTYEIRN